MLMKKVSWILNNRYIIFWKCACVCLVCMYVRVCVCTCVCVCVCVFVCLKKFSEIIPVFSVSIDMHLGTPVFGYCDSKSGKFHPKANFSFTVTSYCNGDRFSFPSWQLEVKDRKKVSFVLIPEYMEKNKEITNHFIRTQALLFSEHSRQEVQRIFQGAADPSYQHQRYQETHYQLYW